MCISTHTRVKNFTHQRKLSWTSTRFSAR